MANAFQPQVAELNSAVTPQDVAPNMSGVQLFADVAQVATEATFSYTGQKELTDLGSKFDKIVQAREAGGNSTSLQIKARADLDAAKANSPWVAEQADKLWRDRFGGGGGSGGGGIFKATPEEQAREKHTQRVEETRLALGLSSSEEAQKRISLDENAKSTKVQAEAQKQVREYNGDLVFSNTQAQINNQSVKMMDAMTRVMNKSGGTLSSEDIRSVNLTVDQTALQLKQELNSQTRDSKTGHLLIGKSGYDSNLKEIEDWVTETKAMAKDNAYLAVIQGLNTEQSAEINFVAGKKYRLIKEVEAAHGQAGVKSFLDISLRPDGVAKDLLIKRSPFAKEMFKQVGSYKQAAFGGFEKVILPTPANIHLTQPEALALGSLINDPANNKMATAVIDKVATEPEAAAPFQSMLKQDPDSSAFLWSDMMNSWAKANKGKAKDVLDTGVSALQSSFKSAYVNDTGSLPKDFTIKIGAMRKGSPTSFGGGPASDAESLISRNVVEGEGITPESGRILLNMYKVFKGNPDYLKQVSTEAGQPLSAEQAVEFSVLGKLPPAEGGDVDRSTLAQPKQVTFGSLIDSVKGMLSKGEGEVAAEDEGIKKAFEADMASATTELEKERVFGKLLRGEYRRDGVADKPEAKPVAEKAIDESLRFTEDDLTLFIKSGKLTEDDATRLRERGLVDGEVATEPAKVFNALEESAPEEIKAFQAALRKATTSTEKAEVHAAFIDGQFRKAK